MMMNLSCFGGLVAAFILPASATLTPVDLRCDGSATQLAAGKEARLTWRVDSAERGVAQTAWQVLVASRPESLAEGKADLWDSGKVKAERLPQVDYQGEALVAGQVCHWKVRCWDADGKSGPWSAPAVWEVAPQAPADWQGARWIDDGKPLPQSDEAFYEPDPAPLMRYEFELSQPVVRARLHFAGIGWGLPSLNGSRVGDHVMDPPWTNFDKRILYSTYDVTGQVQQGMNCLGVELGNGWFNPLPLKMWGGRNIRDSVPTGRPRAIAYLEVEHVDGSRTKVVSGPKWKMAEGPTIRNSIYLGEVRDARLELPGWNAAGFDASAWKAVQVAEAPLEVLRPRVTPPVRGGEAIPAVAVTSPTKGVHIVDFGKNFTGLPDIKLQAPAGTEITFRFGELLHADGSLNPMTSVCGQIKNARKGPDGKEISMGGPGAPNIAWQQDVYIARGGGIEHYQPKFTFHGFRYMEISGLPKTPVISDYQGIPVHSDLPTVGSFSSSNELLNKIQEITTNTFLSNVVSVQSDCAHRERFGYGGDIVASSEAFLMNFDMAGFYAKTVRDWADAARPDGNLTDTAPFVGINYCGVGWAMVHPLLIEQLYQHYGDRRLLEEQLPVAIRWLELEAAARKDGLVTKGLGDHESLANGRGPVVTTPMFVDAARRVARLARLVGKPSDADRFDAMAEESAAAWAASFLDPATGKVGEGTQTFQVLALGYSAGPEASRQATFDRLVEGLMSVPDSPRLSTGIFGTQKLLEELSKNGRGDLAYSLADRKTFPSWGWMLENGATTLWEHWEGSDNTFSNSHPMFGSISGWFFRWLGGIQIAESAVGADRLIIRPQVPKGLEWVKSSHHTVRGLVESNWKVSAGQLTFEIVVPPDTQATIELPSREGDMIRESGRPLAQSKGLELLSAGPGSARMKVGSGHYQFVITRQP